MPTISIILTGIKTMCNGLLLYQCGALLEASSAKNELFPLQGAKDVDEERERERMS